MSNCGKPCTACPFVKTGKTLKNYEQKDLDYTKES